MLCLDDLNQENIVITLKINYNSIDNLYFKSKYTFF